MSSGAATAWLRGFALTVLAAATPWTLNVLSQTQVSAHLADVAMAQLRTAASGEANLHWPLRRRSDLVAGTVFGATQFHFETDGLHIAGRSFEFGLPLSMAVDLRRYAQIQVDLEPATGNLVKKILSAENPASLQLLVREQLDSESLLSSSLPLDYNSQTAPLTHTWPLPCLAWLANSHAASAPPQRAAMLRLRVQVPDEREVVLRSVSLLRDSSQARLDIANGLHAAPSIRSETRVEPPSVCSADGLPMSAIAPEPITRADAVVQILPVDRAARDRLLQARLPNSAPDPIYAVPQFWRPEMRLAWCDEVLDLQSSAILVPVERIAAMSHDLAEADNTATAVESRNSTPAWLFVLGFAALLLILRLYSPRDDRLELLVVLVPMGVAVFTGWIGDDLAPPLLGLCLALAAYVASFARGSMSRSSWIGQPGAWIAAVLLSAAVGMVLLAIAPHRDPVALPSPPTLLRYALWVIIQQYILCVFVYERLARLCSGMPALAVWLAATTFALLHTPNFGLMLATWAGALLWLSLYRKHRALLPIMLAHFLCAIALQTLAAPAWVRSAEVSARYFF